MFSKKTTIAMVLIGFMSTTIFAVDESRLEALQDRIAQCREELGKAAIRIHRLDAALDNIEELSDNVESTQEERILSFVQKTRDELNIIRERIQKLQDLEEVRQICESVPRIHTTITSKMRVITEFRSNILTRLTTIKRVGDEIKKTDRILFRASKLARETDDGEDAFRGLRRAFEQQETAKQQLAASNPRLALQTTFKARQLVKNTVQKVLDEEDREKLKARALEYWKHTNEILSRMTDRIDADNNPRAAKLVMMATELQEKAKTAVDDNEPYKAIRLAHKAREIVNDMAKFAFRVKNIDARSERLESRLDRAETIVKESENEKAEEILEKARQRFEEGASYAEEGKDTEATIQFDMAAKMCAKAVDIAEGPQGKVDRAITHEIRKTNRIVSRASEIAETPDQERKAEAAAKLVEKAQNNHTNVKVSLRLLDKATDLAFSVIAQVKRMEKNSTEE